MNIFERLKQKKDNTKNEKTEEVEVTQQEQQDNKANIETEEKDPVVASCLMELDQAYKEIDYLNIKVKYYELLYNYTKMINDPNTGNASKAYIMYEQIQKYEKILKSYDEM